VCAGRLFVLCKFAQGLPSLIPPHFSQSRPPASRRVRFFKFFPSFPFQNFLGPCPSCFLPRRSKLPFRAVHFLGTFPQLVPRAFFWTVSTSSATLLLVFSDHEAVKAFVFLRISRMAGILEAGVCSNFPPYSFEFPLSPVPFPLPPFVGIPFLFRSLLLGMQRPFLFSTSIFFRTQPTLGWLRCSTPLS